MVCRWQFVGRGEKNLNEQSCCDVWQCYRHSQSTVVCQNADRTSPVLRIQNMLCKFFLSFLAVCLLFSSRFVGSKSTTDNGSRGDVIVRIFKELYANDTTATSIVIVLLLLLLRCQQVRTCSLCCFVDMMPTTDKEKRFAFPPKEL